MINFNKEYNRVFFTENQDIWFTSDTHFGHTNIIKYCNRPFVSIEEHDEELIKRWNSKIKPDDIVFHLGDFAFASEKRIIEILNELNGTKYLIFGNHDWRTMTDKICREYFVDVNQQINIEVDNTHIFLNHFPFLCFSGVYKGMNATWQLFGHVHSGPNSDSGLDHDRLRMLFPTQFDVGVDHNNYYPYNFHEIKQIITDQQISQNIYRG